MEASQSRLSTPGEITSPLQNIADFCFGYDFFISYAWKDGRQYAEALAKETRKEGYNCFLDSDEYIRGDSLSLVGRRALAKSEYMILIVTQSAMTSTHVLREVNEFAERKRDIIPIAFDGLLDSPNGTSSSALLQIITSDILHIDESTIDAPSEKTLADIHKRFLRTRQDRKRARVFAGASVAFLVIALMAIWFWQSSERNRVSAEIQTAVAKSRLYAAFSDTTRQQQPDLSLLFAVEADRYKPTLEARKSLVASLNAYPGLLSHLHFPGADISSLAYSPDGELLAIGFYRDGVMLWDVSRHPVTCVRTLTGAEVGGVSSIVFTPDGTRLVVGFHKDQTSGLLLWDLQQQRVALRKEIPERNARIHAVAVDRLGRAIAIGYGLGMPMDSGFMFGGQPSDLEKAKHGSSGGVMLWDLHEQELTNQAHFKVDEGEVRCVAFSPDGTKLAAGRDAEILRRVRSGDVLFWDVRNRCPIKSQHLDPGKGGLKKLEDFSNIGRNRITSVAFSPDGQSLFATASDDQLLRWDTKKFSLIERQKMHNGWVQGVFFNSEKRKPIMGVSLGGENDNGEVLLFEFSNKREKHINMPAGNVITTALSLDGKTLATAVKCLSKGVPGNNVLLWDLEQGSPTITAPLHLRSGKTVTRLAANPRRKLVAITYEDKTNGIDLWDSASNRQFASLEVPEGSVRDLEFNADGRLLVALWDNTLTKRTGIVLWDVDRRTRVRTAESPIPGCQIKCIAISPKGDLLIMGLTLENGTTLSDAAIAFWDPYRGTQLGDVTPLPTSVVDVVFTSDGRLAAAGCAAVLGFPHGHQSKVVLFDSSSFQRLKNQDLPIPEGNLTCLRILARTSILAAGFDSKLFNPDRTGGGVVLLDLKSRKRLDHAVLDIPDAAVRSIDCNKDGSLLFVQTASSGGGLQMWEADRRVPIILPRPPGQLSSNIAIDADGNNLFVAVQRQQDSYLTTWSITTKAWKRAAAQIANRNFSHDEWRKYFPDEKYRATFKGIASDIQAPASLKQSRPSATRKNVAEVRPFPDIAPRLEPAPTRKSNSTAPAVRNKATRQSPTNPQLSGFCLTVLLYAGIIAGIGFTACPDRPRRKP